MINGKLILKKKPRHKSRTVQWWKELRISESITAPKPQLNSHAAAAAAAAVSTTTGHTRSEEQSYFSEKTKESDRKQRKAKNWRLKMLLKRGFRTWQSFTASPTKWRLFSVLHKRFPRRSGRRRRLRLDLRIVRSGRARRVCVRNFTAALLQSSSAWASLVF